MNNMTIAYIVFGICTLLALAIKATQNNRTKTEQELYTWHYETHDLETWRKRGMDNTKDRNTKGLIKYAEGDKLLGVLYMIYGWDLVKCK